MLAPCTVVLLPWRPLIRIQKPFKRILGNLKQVDIYDNDWSRPSNSNELRPVWLCWSDTVSQIQCSICRDLSVHLVSLYLLDYLSRLSVCIRRTLSVAIRIQLKQNASQEYELISQWRLVPIGEVYSKNFLLTNERLWTCSFALVSSSFYDPHKTKSLESKMQLFANRLSIENRPMASLVDLCKNPIYWASITKWSCTGWMVWYFLVRRHLHLSAFSPFAERHTFA